MIDDQAKLALDDALEVICEDALAPIAERHHDQKQRKNPLLDDLRMRLLEANKSLVDLQEENKAIKDQLQQERHKSLQGINELKVAYKSCRAQNQVLRNENSDLTKRASRNHEETLMLNKRCNSMEDELKKAKQLLETETAQLQVKLVKAQEDSDFKKSVDLSAYMQEVESHYDKKVKISSDKFEAKSAQMIGEIKQQSEQIGQSQDESLRMTQLVAELQTEREALARKLSQAQAKLEMRKNEQSRQNDACTQMTDSYDGSTSPHAMRSICAFTQTDIVHSSIWFHMLSPSSSDCTPSPNTKDHTDDIHLDEVYREKMDNVRKELTDLLGTYRADMQNANAEIMELRSQIGRLITDKENEAEGWRRLLHRYSAFTCNGSQSLLIVDKQSRAESELNQLRIERSALAKSLRALEQRRSNEVASLRRRLSELTERLNTISSRDGASVALINIEYLRHVVVQTLSCSDASVRMASVNALLMILGCGRDERRSIVNKGSQWLFR